jgi:uncharacterized protein YutE (UPF0331/DUF86 family)
MEWKEFAASVIGSIAWPVVVLVITVLVLTNFRTQIRGLIARIKSVKGAGVEATFGEELNDVRDVAEALVEDVQAAETTETSLSEDSLGIIIRAWIELESTVDQLYRGVTGSDVDSHKSTRARLKSLFDAGIVPPAVFHTVSRLYDLRNKVMHGRHFATVKEARSFSDSAYDMVDYLVLTNRSHFEDKPLLAHRYRA